MSPYLTLTQIGFCKTQQLIKLHLQGGAQNDLVFDLVLNIQPRDERYSVTW
jgi:hypothetical protein